MKLTVEDRIIKAKRTLYEKSPFYSYLAMRMVCHRWETETCPTLAVNQFGHLYYNPKFVEKLSDDEIVGVLCHEASHVSTLTFQREKGRNPELWNIATDAVINHLLMEENFSLPKAGIAPVGGTLVVNGTKVQIENRTAEEVYDDLERILNQQKNSKKKGGKQKTQSGSDGNGEGLGTGDGEGNGGMPKPFDNHLRLDYDPDGNHEEGAEVSGEGEDGEGTEGKDASGENGPSKEPKKTKRDKSKAPTSAQRAKNDNDWRSAMAGALAANKGRSSHINSYYEREFNKISESKICWKTILSKFITAALPCDYSMRKPGRRSQGCGIYLPTIVKEGLDVNIGIDMSGSISNEEYNLFMSEVVAIVKGFSQINLTIIPWASQVKADDIQTFSRTNLNSVLEWKSSCCGGTDLSSFTEFMENNPNAYSTFNPNAVNIIFTDGEVEDNPKLPGNKTLVVLTNPSQKHIFKDKCEVVSLKDTGNEENT